MIHWVWALGTFLLGAIFGVLLAAILTANNGDDEK